MSSIPEQKESVAVKVFRQLWSTIVIVSLSLLIVTVLQGIAEDKPPMTRAAGSIGQAMTK